jgi:hypothetical protein
VVLPFILMIVVGILLESLRKSTYFFTNCVVFETVIEDETIIGFQVLNVVRFHMT